MKIAIISSGFLPVIDGVTVSLFHRVRVLSKLGHQVLILCPDYQPVASVYPSWRDYHGEILPGVRVVNLPSEPFMGVEFERNFSRRANRRLNQELAMFDPDIVHVDEPDRIFLGTLRASGVAYAKVHNIPCVGFYHTNFIDYIEDFWPLPSGLIAFLQWFSMLFIRPVFHSYDAILVSSPVTAEKMALMKVRNVLCDRFLGVDVQAFQTQRPDPNFFAKTYKIEGVQDKTKLVFLGRLTPDKGWAFTLRSLAAWAGDPNNAPLLGQIAIIIAGDGELRSTVLEKLQPLANSTGLSVHLLGRIAPNAVPSLLANSDIHITTSEKETLGLTVLEAFAAGIPVIAPAKGGVKTHIRDGKNSLLFEPQNSESFGQALTKLVSDVNLRCQLGQQAQQDVVCYDWENVVPTLLSTWQNQISLHSSS
ncbi:glycosyl transferase, group 1 family protein [Synechococcus sp. PCC 7335]|uniref:glycosyltransferase n=1 Tax=Synechococcus sp. (strain ATCC 29403 / PCC 7335) TaxID=91464 RepID=UPI00017EB7E6|nr:glycosyltransferase [Synechococcus sp. PCC 7335]EDX87563.1 glycosyl transferase, group 1 family protein [Synechococcus sp. PCC 7335]